MGEESLDGQMQGGPHTLYGDEMILRSSQTQATV